MIDSLTRTSAKKVLLRVESWRLLLSNPVLFVPGITVLVLTSTAIWAILQLHLGGGIVGTVLISVVLLFAWLVWCFYVCAMSFSAWQHHGVSLGDGGTELARRPAASSETFAWLFGFGALALAFSPLTLTISMFVTVFFGIHAPLVTLAAEQSGWAAMKESCRHALRHKRTTVLVTAVLSSCAMINGFFVFFGSGDILSIFLQPSGTTLVILLLALLEQALTCYALIFATGCYLRDLYSPLHVRPSA